jgi:peptide chain release factor 3
MGSLSSTESDADIAHVADVQREAERRRTFAIIAHPDAGKTTLTEKLLLYGGAIEIAGAVRGRKSQRAVTSDWMEIERTRGISVTSSALQFEYGGCVINLLDTPGHEDFSEDTYRTLMAVDCAVMVLDAAKGVEAQTRRLFEVCRLRQTPILTFINKFDQPGRAPLELLDEIERTLSIPAIPHNWPIGTGPTFQGVYDHRTHRVLRFERSSKGRRAPMVEMPLDSEALRQMIGDTAAADLREDVALLEGTLPPPDVAAFLAGRQTPVFFGSALHDFGVEPFLEALVHLAPPPRGMETVDGRLVPPAAPFSAFVFKIQANMDRQHRDRMAFLRICSGRFTKDMIVHHARLERELRMTRSHRLFGRDRETVESAYPGDVVGVINPGLFLIGDTLSEVPGIAYPPMPAFQPSEFARLRCVDVARRKQFDRGLAQLQEEGVIRVLTAVSGSRDPILAAAGALQFNIVESRLQNEYGVRAEVSTLPHRAARWAGATKIESRWLAQLPASTIVCLDADDRHVLLFEGEWELRFAEERVPELQLESLA